MMLSNLRLQINHFQIIKQEFFKSFRLLYANAVE